MMRRLTTMAMMAVVAVSLTACGRKGRPIAPEGTIERIYPDIQFPKSQSEGSAQGSAQGSESMTR